MSEFWPELVWRAALAISSGGAGVVAGGAVTGGLEAGDLEAGSVVAGSVVAGSVVAGSVVAGSVAGDGAASFCVEAGGAGLGVAGTSEAAGFTVDGADWMAMGGAEASRPGEVAADVSVGVEVGVEPDAWRNSTIRRLGLARVEEVGSTLSPRSSTMRVTPLAVSATRMRRSSLSSTVSEYMRGPLTTRGMELRMS